MNNDTATVSWPDGSTVYAELLAGTMGRITVKTPQHDDGTLLAYWAILMEIETMILYSGMGRYCHLILSSRRFILGLVKIGD